MTATGAAFQLGASNQIGAAANLVLNGGTFRLNNFSETLGTLDLSAAGGTINFGGNLATLVFADSALQNWNGGTLTVSNYTTGSNFLRFGSGANALGGQESLIVFSGYGLGGAASINSFGFVEPIGTPIPEPTTYAATFGTVVLAFASYRRRRVAPAGT